MQRVNIDDVISILEPVIEDEGFELVDVEFTNEAMGWTLRAYIDKEGGVNVDDCAGISREVSNLLDVEDVIPCAFRLEISSPGLNRPLKKVEHFEKVIGKDVNVTTTAPIAGRRHFKTKLIDVADSSILVEDDGKTTRIDLDNIKKANLIFNF